MPSVSKWTLFLLFAALAMAPANCNDDGNNDNNPEDASAGAPDAPALFVPTMDNFVDLEVDTEGMNPPLKVSFWTTPQRDWDSTLLLRMKPLIVRFQKHVLAFHPHQGIIDGSMIGCHDNNGPNDVSKMSETCLDNCINAGRYCAVFFPELQGQDDPQHGGLVGADLVSESARRLCVWIQYGAKTGEVHKYFDYVRLIRETNCDSSLSDNCLDKVYREADIEAKQIADCLHSAGGVGSQVDMRNSVLTGEMHRSTNMNLTYDELPHVGLNGETVENVTTYSDWQIMAEVCTALSPAPQLCDFCMWECPKGNDNRDPTQQCLWDLTCGDDRTFDDWMQGTGAFANGTSAPAGGDAPDAGDAEDNTEDQEDQNQGEEEETSTDAPTSPPTIAPTVGEKDDEEKGNEDGLDGVEDLLGNSTNTTSDSLDDLPADLGSNDTNATQPPIEPPRPHHVTGSHGGNHTANHTDSEDENKPPPPEHHKKTPAPTPAPKPTPAPHHAKPSYMSPVAPLKPTAHQPPTTNHQHPPTTTHHTPANANGGHGQKAPNTTNPAAAIEGLAIAAILLAGAVVGVYYVQRWRTGKDVYATVDHRDSNGLASTASHAVGNDLELNVEMGATRGGSRSDGYAPPSKGGTWG